MIRFDECVEHAATLGTSMKSATLQMDNLEFVVVFESLQEQKGRDPKLDEVIDALKFTLQKGGED